MLKVFKIVFWVIVALAIAFIGGAVLGNANGLAGLGLFITSLAFGVIAALLGFFGGGTYFIYRMRGGPALSPWMSIAYIILFLLSFGALLYILVLSGFI